MGCGVTGERLSRHMSQILTASEGSCEMLDLDDKRWLEERMSGAKGRRCDGLRQLLFFPIHSGKEVSMEEKSVMGYSRVLM